MFRFRWSFHRRKKKVYKNTSPTSHKNISVHQILQPNINIIRISIESEWGDTVRNTYMLRYQISMYQVNYFYYYNNNNNNNNKNNNNNNNNNNNMIPLLSRNIMKRIYVSSQTCTHKHRLDKTQLAGCDILDWDSNHGSNLRQMHYNLLPMPPPPKILTNFIRRILRWGC
jgi:hypothetical protein